MSAPIAESGSDLWRGSADLWMVFSTKRPYEHSVYICPAEEGGYYAFIPNLPGVASQGETEKEALDNVADAFRGALAVYQEAGEAIPWTDQWEARPANAKEYRIVTDV